jgi:hypothetical protein
MSLLLFINLSSEGQPASASLSNATVTTTNTSSGLANATSATGAVSGNLTSTLGNATIALENATAVATNATAVAANATRLAQQAGANATLVLTNVSQTAANVSQTAAEVELLLEQVKANFTLLSLAQQLQGFGNTIQTSVTAISLVIALPLVLNLIFRYLRGRDTSINQLYRMLVAIGVIFVVILIVVYLNSLIWFNTAQGPSNVVDSLLETQQNFLTILGTAFASLVAFYFGTRGTQDRNSEQNRNSTRTTTTASTGQETTQQALKVDEINPIGGIVGVAVDSPVTATFNTSIRSSTVNLNDTFSVKNDTTGEYHDGNITLTNNNTTIRFNPVPPFNRNTRYTVKITKGIMDISGASLPADVEWHFKTVE